MAIGLLIMALGDLIFIPVAFELILFFTGIVYTRDRFGIIANGIQSIYHNLWPLERTAKRISIKRICNKVDSLIAPVVQELIGDEIALEAFFSRCWTGVHFSDFNAIGPKNIRDEMIEIETKKTGERVVIPIHDVVKAIIQKYDGLTENSLPPSISNVKMNEYLKELGKKVEFNGIEQIRKFKGGNAIVENVPLYNLISTHTARRSFATNMYLLGVPTISIMAITGHRTEKAFLNYIKVTPNQHAVKLKEIWSRHSMKIANS